MWYCEDKVVDQKIKEVRWERQVHHKKKVVYFGHTLSPIFTWTHTQHTVLDQLGMTNVVCFGYLSVDGIGSAMSEQTHWNTSRNMRKKSENL